jgi:hypothetical protein
MRPPAARARRAGSMSPRPRRDLKQVAEKCTALPLIHVANTSLNFWSGPAAAIRERSSARIESGTFRSLKWAHYSRLAYRRDLFRARCGQSRPQGAERSWGRKAMVVAAVPRAVA